MSKDSTYYTTSDSRFFIGTVAMINSLRLTGHQGQVVVLDLGLTEDQRRRLAQVGRVEAPHVTPGPSRKAFPAPQRTTGRIVMIDSDILVVSSLRHLFEAVDRGKICVCHDPDHRWFAEWQKQLALRAPLRRGQRYANAGFVAFHAERWPWLLERWAEVRSCVPKERLGIESYPFRDSDQDPLNAVLMSEVPPGAVHVEPDWAHAHPPALPHVQVVDERALTCTDGRHPVTFLHHSGVPKAWELAGWRRDFREAYIQLLPRVLCDDDVALRLGQHEIPWWLRPTISGGLAFRIQPQAKRVSRRIRAAARRVRSKWPSSTRK